MRMRLNFELGASNITMDYRPIIVSFFKKSIQEKDEAIFQLLYGGGEAIRKDFTFSVYLPNAVFGEEQIEIPDRRMSITFSSADNGLFIRMYNAFLRQRFKPFSLQQNNYLILKSIILENECSIKQDTVTAALLSPLVVRWHQREGNKDKYYVFQDEGFSDALRVVVKNSVSNHEDITAAMVDELQVDCIDCRMVVVRSFGGKIPATLGRLRLQGNSKLLKYLYDAGAGSRTGEGYGLLQI